MSDDSQPKIIVDDDWKSEAKKEKLRLAEESKASQASAEGAEGDDQPLGIMDLIRMFVTQALMYMGAFPDPQTGKAMVALDIARMNIDLLAVLEDKTKGNLSDDESQLLSGALRDLRMQYVEVAKAVEQASKEGRIGADGTIGGPVGGQAGGVPGMGPMAGDFPNA